MKTEVLIVGVSGLIGSGLAAVAAENHVDWLGTSRQPGKPSFIKLDLLDDSDVERFAIQPKIAYLCAGETNLRNCENYPDVTRKANVTQTIKLARKLHATGSQIVFLSSNLVFDGNAPHVISDAPHSPATEYGRQKSETENILLGELERVAVVRLTKVVHPRFPLFRQWRSELMQGNCIHPFSDMLFCPVDLKVVTEELWSLCSLFRRGFFQLSGDADLSYASAAQLLAQCLFIDQSRVQPVTTAEAGYTTYFPRHTSLACEPVSHGRRPEPASTTLMRIFRALEE